MTILGVGIDLVSIPEFNDQLDSAGTTFADVFTVGERRDAAQHSDGARHLAARWAAKEAVVKAWSVSRFGQSPTFDSVSLRDIEVLTDAWGRPSVRLHGKSADVLNGVVAFHVSLTHDGPTAAAVAIAESVGGA